MTYTSNAMDPLINMGKESQIPFQYSPSQNSSLGNSSQQPTHARSCSQEYTRHSVHYNHVPKSSASPIRSATSSVRRKTAKGILGSAEAASGNGNIVHGNEDNNDACKNGVSRHQTRSNTLKRGRSSGTSDRARNASLEENCKSKKEAHNPNKKKPASRSRAQSADLICCCSMREILKHKEFSILNVIGFVHSARSMNYKTDTRKIIEREKNSQAPDNAVCIDFVPLHQPGTPIIVVLWHNHNICDKATLDYIKQCQIYDKDSEPCIHATQLCRSYSKKGFQLIQLTGLQLRYSPLYECWTLQSSTSSQVKPVSSACQPNEAATSDSSGYTFSFSALYTQMQGGNGLSQLHAKDNEKDYVVLPRPSVVQLAKVIGMEAVDSDGASVKAFCDHGLCDLPNSSKIWTKLLKEYIRNCCASCLKPLEEDSVGGWKCPGVCNVPKRNSLREWKTVGLEKADFEEWMKQCGRDIKTTMSPKKSVSFPEILYSNPIRTAYSRGK
eukprot:gb/GECG01015251.1/.p1 GENE.gb/GECG01015251.1/~~gb/GECG01015251.1/.p1  ORF type:complete len:498 (+),score=57.80 gb/GECG01015251.1/:1-1494(+)